MVRPEDKRKIADRLPPRTRRNRAFPGPILPSKAKRELTEIRQHLKLSHDVLRHTFISCHVGAFKSFADAVIEAGNSEKVIRESYLNTSTFSQAKQFWKIEPPINQAGSAIQVQQI
jgi:hypothetical protein